MRVVPEIAVDKLQFFETHLAGWSANAEAIGSSAASVDDVATKAAAARAAYQRQQIAQNAARAATADFQIAMNALGVAGSAIINQVRAKAATAGVEIYTLASIPSPATPSKLGPPGTPSRFTFSLDEVGHVTLNWKCANPRNASGIIYHVSRAIGGSTAPFAFIGGSGKKLFVDDTIPAGVTTLTYRVQAVRTNAVGPAAQFNVSFGVDAETAKRRSANPSFQKAA